MAEQLTPQQEQAIYDRGGSLLVSAAAGSGKTKVLVDRLLSYIMDPKSPANLDDFLIITYTKAAASELRGKIASKLTQRIAENPNNWHLQKQMQRLYLTKISTVHSFCSDILREYAYKLDIPADFRVAEETECEQLQVRVLEQILNEAYENIDQNPDLQTFMDTQGLGRDDRLVPAIILKVYHSSRCHLHPGKWLDWCIESTSCEGMKDAAETLWGQYLIKDLHRSIDLHMDAMAQCRTLVEAAEGMEKVVALLEEDLRNLFALRSLDNWEHIHANADSSWSDFPRKYSDKELAAKVKAVRGACKDEIISKLTAFANSSQQVMDDLSHTGASARGLIYLVNQFAESYDKLKKSRRIMDFSDLEHKTLDLLLGKNRSSATVAAKEISRRFVQIMVDEYQDSNAVQDAIFSVLTEEKRNCFMVGDVKQSIYQFRLADPGIFLEKYERYKNAEVALEGEPRKVMLSRNFRSSGQVINAVNDVFRFCMSEQVGGLVYGEDEMLREGIPHAKNTEPEIELHAVDVQEDTYWEESTYVADRICQLLDGTHTIRCDDGFRPITADDIVILLRSPGSVGADFCFALKERGVRCSMGGSEDLLNTEEISVLWSLLQTISNPLQDIPLVATLSSRVFRFTADELAAIRQKHKHSVFYRSLQESQSDKVKNFMALLDDLRKRSRLCSVTQLIEYIFVKTGMDSIFAAMPDGADRIDNLQMFCQFAASVENTGKKDLEQLLEQLTVLAEKGMVVTSDKKPSNCVTIMSIHKSKGLEFPVVFLCGLSRRFNHKNAQEQVLCDRELGLGLACVDPNKRIRYPSVAKKAISHKIRSEGISEEMRVLYVAMTRARDRLIMTYASDNLSKALTDIAMRMDVSGRQLMTRDVSCPGKWILQTAMMRTEAGQLHAIGGSPGCSVVSEEPWLIDVVSVCPGSEDRPSEEVKQETLPVEIVEKIGKFLNVRYPYPLATQAPSKQTATQLKGRVKDQEASEYTEQPKYQKNQFRTPSFAHKEKTGKVYGNAVHCLMQYLDFTGCGSLRGVEAEIQRIVSQGYLDASMASEIRGDMIYAFFETPIGKKMIQGKHILREFKFSVLDDADKYIPGLENEQVLLQGVVDCALIEDDGITIVDFKTDRINAQSIEKTVDGYKPQLFAYATALSKIYELPIKHAYLYFFHMNELITVV